MPINFHCQNCQSVLQVPDDSAGKSSRCPSCGTVQPIPANSNAPTASPAPPSPASPPPPGYPAQAPGYPPQGASPYSAPMQQPGYSPGYQPPGGFAPPQLSRQQAKNKMFAPALCLLIINSIGLLVMLAAAIGGFMDTQGRGLTEDDMAGFVGIAVFASLEMFGIFGAIFMLRMKLHTLCIISSVISMLSGACCLVQLGFSIWALVALLDPQVKQHFR